MTTETKLAYLMMFSVATAMYVGTWRWTFLVIDVMVVGCFILTHFFVKVWKEEFKRQRQTKLKSDN